MSFEQPNLNNKKDNILSPEQLSEKERELVKRIEQLPIADGEKIDLILAWRELKPASALCVVLKKYTREGKPILSEEDEKKLLKKVKLLAWDLGLTFIEGAEWWPQESMDDVEQDKICDMFVARRPELALELARQWYKMSNPVAEKQIGILLGYPETAVNAFKEFKKDLPGFMGERKSESPVMSDEDFPEQIRKQDFMAFSDLRLSKKHWHQELKLVEKWAEEIKKLSPSLYQRKVKRYEKRLLKDKKI